MGITEIAALLTALGVGAILRAIATRVMDWLSGRATHRRAEVDRAEAEKQSAIDAIMAQKIAEVKAAHEDRDAARRRAQDERDRADGERDRADAADRKRRILQEYASQLRSAMFEQHQTPPPWPVVEDTLPRAEIQRLKREGKSND